MGIYQDDQSPSEAMGRCWHSLVKQGAALPFTQQPEGPSSGSGHAGCPHKLQQVAAGLLTPCSPS